VKVIRVISYEGDMEGLNRQLASSMPDGVRNGVPNVRMEIRTVVDERPKDMADVVAEQVKRMQEALHQQIPRRSTLPTGRHDGILRL
jgi:hypothetical protein